tara:strand:- start:761 stop:1927 length:1167 start_codon:yes stop_codon:yes gene_type:complete
MSKNSWFDPFYVNDHLNIDELEIQKNVREFCKKELLPNVINNNINHKFDKNLYKLFGSLGILGPDLNEYGGAGTNYVSYGLIAYEIEKIDSSYRSSISVQSSLVINPIYKFGSKEQKETYLPDLILGNKIGCFGLTESEAGSDPSSMKTTFEENNNEYVINGSKNWITNAPIADLFVVWALNTRKELRGFLIDRNTKGLTTSYINNKTSLKISPTGLITLNNVRIPKKNILPKTEGWKSVFSCLNKARYGISWGVLGAATNCWMIAKEYTENRIMFKKPLASNQLIQKKLADMQTEINLSLSACLLTGRAMDKNKETKIAISILKRNNCKKAINIAREARDMLGANGLLEEYHIIRHLLNLETVKTYEGTEDIHTLILGKNQTDLSAF